MRIALVAAFVILYIQNAYCTHPYMDGDMECTCWKKMFRHISVQINLTFTGKYDSTLDGMHRPVDCKDVYDNGQRSNGVYRIYPKGNIHGYEVYCDMTTDGGGWTVFQRRFDGKVDFYRSWNQYRNGFGDVDGEYWLGNEKIHQLTTGSKQVLRIDLMDYSKTWKYAKYTDFSITGEKDGYKLLIGKCEGNAGDSLAYHKGFRFQTKDRPGNSKCPITYHGAWWYKHCHHANLNGKYGDNTFGKGLNWYSWRGHKYSLQKTEMKIRREK